jgi:hypothetical protein
MGKFQGSEKIDKICVVGNTWDEKLKAAITSTQHLYKASFWFVLWMVQGSDC